MKKVCAIDGHGYQLFIPLLWATYLNILLVYIICNLFDCEIFTAIIQQRYTE